MFSKIMKQVNDQQQIASLTEETVLPNEKQDEKSKYREEALLDKIRKYFSPKTYFIFAVLNYGFLKNIYSEEDQIDYVKKMIRQIRSYYLILCKNYDGKQSEFMLKIGKKRFHYEVKSGIIDIERLLKEILMTDK